MVVFVGDHGAIGKVAAPAHYSKIKEVLADLRKVDPQFDCVALATDNEATMKSVRNLYRNDGGTAVGCGSHGGNKALGIICHFTSCFVTVSFNVYRKILWVKR